VWQQYFKNHDVFLIPVTFTTAFPHDHRPFAERTIRTPEGTRPYDDLLFWSSFATFSGLPSTVAPVGLAASGLPVGIQIIGPYLEDATSIDFAAKMADVIGGYQRPPLSS
jgi:amidase